MIKIVKLRDYEIYRVLYNIKILTASDNEAVIFIQK